MKNEKRYYIAYGSNLSVTQMHWRCPDAKVVGKGELNDWRLLFKGSKTGSYLTIERCKGSKVPVAVWEVSERDEAALDRYEGYPSFYYKEELTFEFRSVITGKKHKAIVFVYIMHEDRPLGIPSEHYLKICAAGYYLFKFDTKYLKEALHYSEEVME
ncbi:MAG: gamma-glutamylcyclotransferase [Firmicutes bacterium]|nr:gamma-glutamylcyclotransferase [Bacillota bacterium]